jgi:hypothetical protein
LQRTDANGSHQVQNGSSNHRKNYVGDKFHAKDEARNTAWFKFAHGLIMVW